jgi:hypothetical protein
MLRSQMSNAYIVRMRSRLQPDMYIDVFGSDDVQACRDKAILLAMNSQYHLEFTILDTATLGDHGIFYGVENRD